MALVEVYYEGSGWSNKTVYVDTSREIAIVSSFRVTHWGYHDECDTEETKREISISEALEMVYPDRTAIRKILECTGGNYTGTLSRLAEKQEERVRRHMEILD